MFTIPSTLPADRERDTASLKSPTTNAVATHHPRSCITQEPSVAPAQRIPGSTSLFVLSAASVSPPDANSATHLRCYREHVTLPACEAALTTAPANAIATVIHRPFRHGWSGGVKERAPSKGRLKSCVTRPFFIGPFTQLLAPKIGPLTQLLHLKNRPLTQLFSRWGTANSACESQSAPFWSCPHKLRYYTNCYTQTGAHGRRVCFASLCFVFRSCHA